MEEEIFAIATEIFGLHDGDINIDSNPQNTENWDSMRHMRLIIETEKKFNVEIGEDEITSIVDMSSLVATITKLQR